MFAWAQEDLDLHTFDQVEAKLMEIGQKLRSRARDCPVVQRMKKQVVRLMKLLKKAKKVTDLPTDEEFMNWWGQKNFEPWM